MDYYFTISFGGHNWRYRLLPYDNYQVIDVDGCVHLRIFKSHNHHYELAGFFYRSKRFVYPRVFRSKRELFGAIQKLLQEELYDDVQ